MEDWMTTRILLVEDDPTTAAFLAAAAQGVPAEVDVAGSCAAALALAGDHDGHDLWLIDANLPDGDGAGLLATLRARGLRATALAHTAALEPHILAALREAGFREVLVKPMPASTLQVAVRDALGLRVAEAPSPAFRADAFEETWDDAAALAALNGERAHVDALRKLFLGELPDARDSVREAAQAGEVESLRAALHRLRASCGFVGAARMATAVAGLQESPHSGPALSQFLQAAQDTLSSASVADEP
jgi:CheY-like chemotaxis protein/HPt (histidine-containing phosphotransfer) domain-containing protein